MNLEFLELIHFPLFKLSQRFKKNFHVHKLNFDYKKVRLKTHRAVVCVDITTAISSIPFTTFGIEIIITIVISMPASWCALFTFTIL